MQSDHTITNAHTGSIFQFLVDICLHLSVVFVPAVTRNKSNVNKYPTNSPVTIHMNVLVKMALINDVDGKVNITIFCPI